MHRVSGDDSGDDYDDYSGDDSGAKFLATDAIMAMILAVGVLLRSASFDFLQQSAKNVDWKDAYDFQQLVAEKADWKDAYIQQQVAENDDWKDDNVSKKSEYPAEEYVLH